MGALGRLVFLLASNKTSIRRVATIATAATIASNIMVESPKKDIAGGG